MQLQKHHLPRLLLLKSIRYASTVTQVIFSNRAVVLKQCRELYACCDFSQGQVQVDATDSASCYAALPVYSPSIYPEAEAYGNTIDQEIDILSRELRVLSMKIHGETKGSQFCTFPGNLPRTIRAPRARIRGSVRFSTAPSLTRRLLNLY